jgi:mitochondrial enoyl-[acyl-carrier protein] reductase / trans-2-enoyl-CoA reductase
MRAVQISSLGNPVEVAKLTELPDPGPPGSDEALIEVEYSPIDPADLLQIRGLYGVRPKLPATAGSEGVGRIVATGASVPHVAVGDRVLLPMGRPAWQELVRVPAKDLFVAPDADPKQLSMLAINPPTAALMLKSYVSLSPGDWIVQNAGNSGVGRAVAAFAREWGLRLISVVRRESLIDELNAEGGEVVLMEGRDLASRVADVTGKSPVRLGLDALAGEAGFSLAATLASDATLVVYAALSGKPLSINPLNVIFRGLTVRGFWLGHPAFGNTPAYHEALVDSARLVASGKLRAPIAATYPIDRFAEAIAHAQVGGKVLLDLRTSQRAT